MPTESLEILREKVSFDNTQVAFAHKSDMELMRAYYLFLAMNYKWLVDAGTGMINIALGVGFPIKFAIKPTLFLQFCGGESIQDCEATIRALSKAKIGTILDYSVEGAGDEASFDRTTEETIATIRRAHLSLDIPFCVFKVTGVASTPLLEKIQAGQPLTADETAAWQRVQARVDRICKTAFEQNVRLFIDGEETWIQDTIDDLAYEMMRRYNRSQAVIYNTYQMYVAKKLAQLKDALRIAARDDFYLGAKVVRGAYMEKERARATEKGYPDPIQPDKETCDKDYNEALDVCLRNRKKVALCAGTHNEYSSYYLMALMEKYSVKPADPHVWFSQLYGMSDNISYNLAYAGYNVAKYVPYGPVEAVLPYLFRRADENTAIAGQTSREFNLVRSEIQRRRAAK